MKLVKIIFLIGLTVILGCRKKEPVAEKTEWIEKPVSEWPALVMTNAVGFADTTYRNIANAFLVDTGSDTLAVTCKHIFMVFREETNNTVFLGDNFRNWEIYPKGQPGKSIRLGQLVNQNKNEATGVFNTLKSRDWLVFKIKDKNSGFTPLKIRQKPVSKGEIVFTVGWAFKQTSKTPSLIKMQVYRNEGIYFYTQTLTQNVDPAGRSGSPVIDKNGYLVGIVSGAEGNLGVSGAVTYLLETFSKFEIPHKNDL